MRILGRIFIFLIFGLRPLFGPQGTCRFPITCTQYAEEQFKEKSFLIAILYIIKRVIYCNPFFKNFK